MIVAYRLTIHRLIDGRRVAGTQEVEPSDLSGVLCAEGQAPGTILRIVSVAVDRSGREVLEL